MRTALPTATLAAALLLAGCTAEEELPKITLEGDRVTVTTMDDSYRTLFDQQEAYENADDERPDPDDIITFLHPADGRTVTNGIGADGRSDRDSVLLFSATVDPWVTKVLLEIRDEEELHQQGVPADIEVITWDDGTERRIATATIDAHDWRRMADGRELPVELTFEVVATGGDGQIMARSWREPFTVVSADAVGSDADAETVNDGSATP